MSYLSDKAVTWAIRQLKASTHPFLGITFLACKKGDLPVGETELVRLDTLTDEHLRRHHRLDPESDFFFQPFRSTKNWVTRTYASTGLQAINTQTFGSVFLHERGRPRWGFAEDYVDRTKSKNQTLGHRRVPLAAIAIWTLKDEPWPDDTTADELIDEFVWRFEIRGRAKRELFSEQSAVLLDPILLQLNKPDLKAVAYKVEPPPDADEPEGTLTAIQTKRVGPADEYRLELGERLTVIAGDNGLGKSFLLEVVWWAATGGWASRPATPLRKQDAFEALIEYELRTDAGVKKCASRFYSPTQSWVQQSEYPHVGGLYVYAMVDGAFSVADDLRERTGESPMNFAARQVWDGKANQTEGLIRDWVSWQRFGEEPFSLLEEVLECLSPSDLGLLKLGRPTRLPGDSRLIPVISHPYGEVPVLYASAGVRRILAIAYMVVWSWQEHLWASELLNEEAFRRVVLLVDEVEAHLHPVWQRTILPAILRVGELLGDRVEIQTIVSTHSPLVLASLETKFRMSSDALFHLSLRGTKVVLESKEFAKYGDASSWLTSPIVGLDSARSKEAERAIERARKIQLSRKAKRSEVEEVSLQLMEVLLPDDPFWRRWAFFAEQAGVKL